MTTELNSAPVIGRKENLVNEIKGMVGNAGELLDQAGQAVATEAGVVAGKARCMSAATQQYVHRNPWTIVGIAATAGLVIGALLSRR